MKPLYTELEFKTSKGNTMLPLECKHCYIEFHKTKKFIMSYLNPNTTTSGDYCSLKCYGLATRTAQEVICLQCDKQFSKFPNKIKKSNGKNFCCKKCAAIYNVNTRKPTVRNPNGSSKLEKYIKTQLELLYPKLIVKYNDRFILNGKLELDIYIPSLKIAFEINGIHHYEPIFGMDRLKIVQINDLLKNQISRELRIDLFTINTSKQQHVTSKNSQPYLDIITTVINSRL